MTAEDIKNLRKYLSASLPYGVKYMRYAWNYEWDQEMPVVEELESISKDGLINKHGVYKVTDIKPYLRPMSSMTEEEKDEFHRLKQMSVTVVMPNGVSRMNPEYIVDINDDGDDLTHLYDWLLENHFDFRGFIEKGLALEAPEDMYKKV